MRTRRPCQLCLVLRTLEAQAFRAGRDIKGYPFHLTPHPCLLQPLHVQQTHLPSTPCLRICCRHKQASCSAPWVCGAKTEHACRGHKSIRPPEPSLMTSCSGRFTHSAPTHPLWTKWREGEDGRGGPHLSVCWRRAALSIRACLSVPRKAPPWEPPFSSLPLREGRQVAGRLEKHPKPSRNRHGGLVLTGGTEPLKVWEQVVALEWGGGGGRGNLSPSVSSSQASLRLSCQVETNCSFRNPTREMLITGPTENGEGSPC